MARIRKGNPPTRDALLLIMDTRNLYYSAREIYGGGCRIDFFKVRDRVVQDRIFGAIYGLALVPSGAENLDKALKKAGFDWCLRAEDFNHQLEGLIRLGSTYQIIAVASGDGAFLPLYRVLKLQNKRLEVYSFEEALNDEVPPLVDDVTIFGADVLVGNFKTLANLGEV